MKIDFKRPIVIVALLVIIFLIGVIAYYVMYEDRASKPFGDFKPAGKPIAPITSQEEAVTVEQDIQINEERINTTDLDQKPDNDTIIDKTPLKEEASPPVETTGSAGKTDDIKDLETRKN